MHPSVYQREPAPCSSVPPAMVSSDARGRTSIVNRAARLFSHTRGAPRNPNISKGVVANSNRIGIANWDYRDEIVQRLISADRVLCDGRGRRDGISERHADSVLRPQNDHRTSFDRLARSQLKVVFSKQIAQNHKDLQHRVVSPDTTSRSGPEGKESEGRAQLVVRLGEPLGIEFLRILPVARSMVRTVDIYNDRRSAGYGEIAYAVVRNSHAVNHPERRVEAQRFQDHLSR